MYLRQRLVGAEAKAGIPFNKAETLLHYAQDELVTVDTDKFQSSPAFPVPAEKPDTISHIHSTGRADFF